MKYIVFATLISLCLLIKAQNVSRQHTASGVQKEINQKAKTEQEYLSMFSISDIDDATYKRMYGKSYKAGAAISRNDLCYLRIPHYDVEGKIHVGEMVCNKAIANELIDIFKQLFKAKYAIQQMRLVDEYDADDERSMTANNTSCFNYRAVNGSKVLSAHSRGMAIDINPLYNPCVRVRNGKRIVEPTSGDKYSDRSKSFTYKIDTNDLAYKLFVQHGFKWGGAWRTVKDYQHFEK